MTKSKLLKLLGKHNPNMVVIRYYDFKKMELVKLENIVNNTRKPFASDETFYVCKECTLGDIITSLKVADSVNDYIYQGDNHTYRDIYEDLNHIIKHPIYIPVLVDTSAKEYEDYYNIHKEKILKHYEDNRKLLSMFAAYANRSDSSLFS
jgi:hypothetical protein